MALVQQLPQVPMQKVDSPKHVRATGWWTSYFVTLGCQKTLASTGGGLFRWYGITIWDALTRAGVEIRQQLFATFAHLREEQKHPYWENGADVRYLKDAGVRVGNNGGRDGSSGKPSAPTALSYRPTV
ncbi:hypothetical protein Vretimale_767 [Volvox reticuliferus]|uniref:Uncharacterized protein n=1 Tax=Volvox reticuliferus TaxID=1737510 RepID=A0A8J4C278_9CHLO|nr:hypothetical protein Vretifemale_2105 [Volvox reticuliferus]GIL94534.1 hypothetical protein Vretimale_767 [Volvox reticuliferus]